jgi:hypothetical protein
VAAVALNVTATGPSAAGWVTAWPAGAPAPLASNLNFAPDQTIANAVVVGVGTGGQVSLGNALGCTDIVVDVVGWYATPGGGASATGTPGAFTAAAPSRLLDTRSQGGCLAGSPRSLLVAGRGGIPDSGVAAVLVNVTATGATAPSWLTVYAGGTSPPATSSLNFGPGASVPNLVVAPVGADGTIRVQNARGCAHVVVDVAGWFAASP